MLRFKELRGKKSQLEISHELGIPSNTYSNYESGMREASYSMLCKIADFYHVPIDYLIGHESERLDLEKMGKMVIEDEQEKELIMLFRSAPQPMRDMIMYNASVAQNLTSINDKT